MASGTGLAALLSAVKANAVAVAVAGTVVVGGGAAALAVTTGAVQLPGQASATHTPDTDGTSDSAAARQNACMTQNGEASTLAQDYAAKLFGKDQAAAQKEICTLFVGTDGRAFGFGEVRQMLDLAVAVETSTKSNTTNKACTLTFTAPTTTDAAAQVTAVDALLNKIMQAVASGTPVEQLNHDCGVTHGDANNGNSGNGAKPTGTPGARPTGTPGRP
jgi:malic enzyme